MNVKDYEGISNLDTDTLYKFLENSIEKQLKEEHTLHEGFGTYIANEFAPNKYLALTFFKNFKVDKEDKHAVYLSKVAVCPQHKGNGFGKKILKCALDLCKNKGYGVVYLRVDNNNIYFDKNKNKKHIGEYYEKVVGAEKIADVAELFESGGEIYKIVLDGLKAAEIDDSVYVEEIKKMPEDFYKI